MKSENDLERTAEGFRTRLRYGKGLRGRFVIKLSDEPAAERRAAKLRELAALLAATGHSAEAPIILRKGCNVQTDREFAEVVQFAESLCGKAGAPDARKLHAANMTFRKVGEMWTDGTFHREFPDQVEKVIQYSNQKRLEKSVYPFIGDRPIRLVTRADCDGVMRKLNEIANRGRAKDKPRERQGCLAEYEQFT